jgi:hypothetical protein
VLYLRCGTLSANVLVSNVVEPPELTLQINFDPATYISISLCFNNELNSCGPRISMDCILFGIASTRSISLITLLAIPMSEVVNVSRLISRIRTVPVSSQVVVITRWTQASCGLSPGYERAEMPPWSSRMVSPSSPFE